MQGQPADSRIHFFLDESLPPTVAEALALVEYEIVSSRSEGLLGLEDEQLIPLLGERGCVWITKDDAAKSEHRSLIQRAGISVVWVRGVERTRGTTAKNTITVKDVHRMLTLHLDKIAREVAAARGPRYFLLHMAGDRPMLKTVTSIEAVQGLLGGRRRRP